MPRNPSAGHARTTVMSVTTLHPAMAVPAGRSVRARVSVPALAVAGLTAWLVWVGASTLSRAGLLASALRGGWLELAGPLVLGLVLVAMVCEQIWPVERRPLSARGRVHDACFLIVYALCSVPVMVLMGVAFAVLLQAHATFLEDQWTPTWPLWLLLPVTLLLMDGANWVAHWADHRFRPLWRFHALHHSQEEMSVLTSFRAHPLTHATGFFLATIPVLALMGDRSVAPMVIAGYVCLGTLPHSNVRWSFGPLGRLIVSPAYHRIHHAIGMRDGANLGIVLTIWDVLAGRAIFPTPAMAVLPTGLVGRPIAVEQADADWRPARRVAAQLMEPFSRS
jgi:sterol desaturase/sphingolipid hydroxylase (fatty acid hydroxylase superfamily)